MNPPPTGTAALTADEAVATTHTSAPEGGASDEPAATAAPTTAPAAAEVEGQVWSRLRDYEAEEAQSINQRLLTRHQRTDHHDAYTPDGDVLFTERYIQRYLEEEERTKTDWTRNLDNSTARFRAASGVGGIGAGGEYKESDAATHRHYDTTGDEDEGGDYYNHRYDDAVSDNHLGTRGGASHHSVRSSLSSVGRALGRKVKHSSTKIASSLGNAGRRAHHRGREKGKEAASSASSAWPDYSAVAADYGYASPPFNLAGVGGLGVVPGTAVAGEEERSFPLFSAGIGGVGPSSSSASAAAAGSEFEKSWERDYSPFSAYAFDQRSPQPANASGFAYDDSDDDDGDDELPPLENLGP